MAEFYGRMAGSGADVTRTGTKQSGIDCTLNSHTLRVMTRIHNSVNFPHGFVHAEFGSGAGSAEFGNVYFGKDYGTDKPTFVVTPRFIYNCDRAKLVESIMADDEMVKLLCGRIFIEGKADVANTPCLVAAARAIIAHAEAPYARSGERANGHSGADVGDFIAYTEVDDALIDALRQALDG